MSVSKQFRPFLILCTLAILLAGAFYLTSTQGRVDADSGSDTTGQATSGQEARHETEVSSATVEEIAAVAGVPTPPVIRAKPDFDHYFKRVASQGRLVVAPTTFDAFKGSSVGDRLTVDLDAVQFSGTVIGVKEASVASKYALNLDDGNGRIIYSVDGNGKQAAQIAFNQDARAFWVSELEGLQFEDGLLVEQVAVSELYCAPPGVVYPLSSPANASLLGVMGSPYSPSSKLYAPLAGPAAPPKLDSIPGAEYVLYCDFDGELIEDFDFFLDGEDLITVLAAPHPKVNDVSWVTAVWKRVSEDFAPFNITVTTDRAVYDNADTDKRLHVVITPTDTAAPGAGGVAADIGYFRTVDPVCWVYSLDEYGCASTISHEAGHVFGLSHDGRTNADEYYGGHNTDYAPGWAPIMGAPWSDDGTALLVDEVDQWSRGEYLNANNQQDDLAIIAGVSNGFGYKGDEYANTYDSVALPVGSLTNLPNNAVSGSGLISRTNDIDVFSFVTASGDIDITVSPLDVDSQEGESDSDKQGANLAVNIRLLDSTGTAIATGSEAGPVNLASNIQASVPFGTYYIEIDGGGRGTGPTVGFSDYASLGQYTISGTIATPPLAVSGGGKVLQAVLDNSTQINLSNGTNFGFSQPSAAPVTHTFYLENTSDFDINNLAMSLADGNVFEIASAVPTTLPVGASVPVSVAYDPNVNGLDFDTVSITYDGEQSEIFTFLIGGTSSPTPNEDNYEHGFQLAVAEDLTNLEDVLLSEYKGLGWLTTDYDDIYKFTVEPGDQLITVETFHDPSQGAIQFRLFRLSGAISTLVSNMFGEAGSETLEHVIPANATSLNYYILVEPVEDGTVLKNTYDLRWNARPLGTGDGDLYEDNDSASDAFNLTNAQSSRLSEILGTATQTDEDWYRIDVPRDPFARFLYVSAEFVQSEGNIDIELYDENLNRLSVSAVRDDREFISYFEIISTSEVADDWTPAGNTAIQGVPEGSYYVRVTGDNAGNTYDMFFGTLEDDTYEIVGFDSNGDIIENDTLDQPFDLGDSIIGTSLSNIDGFGMTADYAVNASVESFGNLNDGDFYKFSINQSNVTQVQVAFTGLGVSSDYLTYRLRKLDGSLVDSFTTNSDNPANVTHTLTINNPDETEYLIYVEAAVDIGYLTAYDFTVTLITGQVIIPGAVEDNYEQNDRFDEPFNISGNEGAWLTSVDGYGALFDADWYRINVPTGATRLEVIARSDSSLGNIDIYVTTKNGLIRRQSLDGGDTEIITWDDPDTGPLSILVAGDRVGNRYNLYWEVTLPEDNYEENDTRSTSFDLTGHERRLLSKLDGLGIQNDEDWYRIQADALTAELRVLTTFSHGEGDIDVELYNEAGYIVARAVSTDDNETLLLTNPPVGNYYVRVYYGNTGNEYDLSWGALTAVEVNSSVIGDDDYEDNDTEGEAYGLTSNHTRLSNLLGPGLQLDDDWYAITIGDDNFGLYVECLFDDSEGDIDMEIYDDFGTPIIRRDSSTDNEILDLDVSVPGGIYYIRIYGPNLGNAYDLYFIARNEDIYEENDSAAGAYDINALTPPLADFAVATQSDDDWFKITVDQNNSFLEVELDYLHENGNIDLKVYDASNLLVADSLTADDTESVFFKSGAGDYFIKVFGDNEYNEYDLTWNVFEDDIYEENDERSNSANIITDAGTVINGAQFDDDWYRVNVSDANSTLFVNLSFIHADGNIDLELYDSSNTVLASSASTSDSEAISLQVPVAGDYFIRVFGANLNTSYSLIWNAVLDDAFEENDTLLTAANITGSEETPLDGVELDEDWFRIDLPARDVRFEAILSFLNDEGDLTLALYDSSENLLRSSSTTNDGEQIIFGPDPAGATYYLLVSGPSIGTDYTLTWSSTQRDGYEGESGNNTIDDAFDISAVEGRFLTEFEGQSTLFDEDWYRIERNGEGLLVQAEFLHAEGNIDIDLFNNVGDRILVGTSATDLDVERIVYTDGDNGIYYIRVYGDLNGNAYDLFWRDFNEDDEEVFQAPPAPAGENDISENAVSLVSRELVLINNLTQLDDDWYRVKVDAGDRLTIDCQFEHLGGDIDIELYEDLDPLGAPEAFSNSQTDNEFIDIDTLPAGYYLLRVHGRTSAEVALGDPVKGRDLANTYSLRWNSAAEDPYDLPDNNNQRIDAYELPQLPASIENFDLRDDRGDGVQFDDDWYQVDVNLGSNGIFYFFFVDLILGDSAQGNLDLELYDENGLLLRTSATDNVREAIVYSANSDASIERFFIRVFGENVGQSYNLSVGTLPDDRFEDNDTSSQADSVADLTPDRGVSVPGLLQVDDDYYVVDVPAGQLRLLVDIFFRHNFGNLSLEVFNAAQQSLGRAATSNDDETLDVFIPEAGGRFYILVEGSNDRVPYSLQWDYTDEDRYEENDDGSEAFELTEFEGNDPPVTQPLYPLLDDGEALGIATQTDEDWYAVTLPASHISLFVDIDFDHLLGDLALAVYDATGTTLLGSADSADDNETLAVHLPGGEVTYLIRVEGPDSGNRYSLAWSSSPEDLYEQNDFITEAYDLTSDEGIDLSLINGQGATLDDDWYVIVVSDSSTIMEVGLAFSGSNPIFEVYQLVDADPIEENDDGIDQRRAVLLPRPDTSASPSVFSLANPMPGLYYIRVSSLTGRQNYDLVWFDDGDSSGDAVYTDDLGNFVFSNPNPAIRPADFDENPDGDAFPNWAEFALGLSETSYDAQVTSQGLQEVGGVDYFTIEFIRSKEAVNRGFRFIVEESNNLTFDGDEAVFVATESISATHERVTYRSSAPIKGAPACFFKVRVQQPSDGF